jgi:hypothetical protein
MTTPMATLTEETKKHTRTCSICGLPTTWNGDTWVHVFPASVKDDTLQGTGGDDEHRPE